MPAASNRLIADRYALERPIGRGGMGVVWLAHDRLLDREVAIKEVTVPDTVPELERKSLRARAMREARAAARLSHPGAITLFDVLNERGRAFIVMELVKARTLAEIVAKEGPLPPATVARIGLQVASALDAAHRAGIIHRDVKPANVMVAEDGTARLADFGIAQVQGDDPKLTSTGMIVGSPAYMAPEQASGKGSGPETDLWGLGGTMYYAVEGRPPFERDNSIATLTAVVRAAPSPPRRAGALAPLIIALLAKDPADRPSMRQLRMRLARVITAGWETTAAQPALPPRVPAVPAGVAAPVTDVAAPAPMSTPMPDPAAISPGPGAAAPPPRQTVTTEAEVRKRLSTATAQIPALDFSRLGLGWRWSRRSLAPIAFLVAVLVIVLVAAVARPAVDGHANSSSNSSSGTAPRHASAGAGTAAGSKPAAATGPTPSRGAASAQAGPAPASSGWSVFGDPSAGYRIAYPAGWQRQGGGPYHRTVVADGVGQFFQVESSSPPLGDPMTLWTAAEAVFAKSHPGYHRLRLERGSYHGIPAAVWEFTQPLGGRTLHKLDVTFASPSGHWGYAVLFTAPDTQWAQSQDLAATFERGFVALG